MSPSVERSSGLHDSTIIRREHYGCKGGNNAGERDGDRFLEAAIEEARLGEREGGIPIGSVLVIDGRIVGRGHNRRVQRGSAVLHAEMDCLENAGRLRASEYAQSTLYSTLSPCDMCSGAVLLYGIPRVVIGENTHVSRARGPFTVARGRARHSPTIRAASR